RTGQRRLKPSSKSTRSTARRSCRPGQRGREQNSKERQVTDIRDLAESETHLRAHLPSGDRRRGLGPLDDESRSRIVVGPGGIRDERQQARNPAGWQVRIREEGDRFGPNGKSQRGRSPSQDG